MNDYTSKEDEDFFGSIGRLTISWAYIELGIDLAVSTIYRQLGGDKIDKRMPFALQRKLTFLKQAANVIATLSPYRDRLINLAHAVEKHSGTRHDIIHGFVVEHLSEVPRRAKLVRLLRKGDTASFKPVVVTTISILEEAVKADQIATHSLALGIDLARNFGRE